MSDVQLERENKVREIEEENGMYDCPATDMESIDKILLNYVTDDDNYVVDGAIISCNKMSNKSVTIKCDGKKIEIIGEMEKAEIPASEGGHEGEIYETFYEVETANDEIGELSAVHAINQTNNGLLFATVIDCNCMRDIDEGKRIGEASIISMGNCKIVKKSDIKEIEEREGKAKQYGTCYCLVKPDIAWENPLCMESVTGDCNAGALLTVGAARIVSPSVCRNPFHHKTMEWDTEVGNKEGLTKLSTLLCTRGGIITIVESGQIARYSNDKESFSSIAEFKARYEGLIKNLIIQYDLKIDIDVIGRVIYIESSGNGFDNKGRMLIRFENSVFYNQLQECENSDEKIATFNEYFQFIPNDINSHKINIDGEFVDLHPKTEANDLQYLAIEYAEKIDKEAAYSSFSMGVGQIMGFNHEYAGYESAEEMFKDMSQGYSYQIEGMIRYLKALKYDEKSLSDFFEDYNGDGDGYMERYNKAIW